MSQSSVTPNPPSFDEREERMNVEMLDGIKLMSPRPSLPHALAAGKLFGVLDHCFSRKSGGPPDRPGGWTVLFDPELHLGDCIVIPDIAAWRRDRVPRPNFRAATIQIAPDWVCEVLSESTAKYDRQFKLPIYHRNKVDNVWLVDPLLQMIELYRRSETAYFFMSTHSDNEQLRAEPFSAIEIPLEEIWPDFE